MGFSFFSLRSKKLIVSLPIFTAVSLGGCQYNNLNASSKSGLPTHRAVASPRLLGKSSSTLLVALESFLGPLQTEMSLSSALNLRGGEKPIVLRDAIGNSHTAFSISLKWRKESLSQSFKFARQVVGPFASFESADRVASALKTKGYKAVIARPKEWEVWVSQKVQLPKSFQSNLFQGKLDYETQPFVVGANGSTNINLIGPVKIDAPSGLFWKGSLYKGSFILQKDAYGTWTLVEQLPLEKYLEGVVPHEIGSSSPFEALKAQAILARTWALANSHRFSIDGYNLCSDTQCQVYKNPSQASPIVKKAINDSSGKVLMWKGQPINAVYHATNGGVMASAQEAWAIKPLPYFRVNLDGSTEWRKKFFLPFSTDSQVLSLLRAREGANGSYHHRFRWTRTFNAKQLSNLLQVRYPHLSLPKEINILSRGPSGRVLALEIRDGISQPLVLRLDAIRRTLRQLPSTLFVIRPVGNGVWNFLGGGFGHGVGLSQSGAIDLAERGWNSSRILSYYYPSTSVGSVSAFKANH